MILSYSATGRDEGRKVYYVLRNDLWISSSLLRRMKKCGAVTVNGELCYTDRLLHAGDVLSADVGMAEPPCDIVPESGPVSVIFENGWLLGVNKPEGMLIHPTHSKNEHTLSNFVAGYLAGKGETPVCHAVNRLDRDTSGVVLFAKNTYAKALLSDDMADAEKTYLAVLYGKLEGEGTVDVPIRRAGETEMRRIASPDGAHAVTHYRVLENTEIAGEWLSLAELRLETGRTHQIRVHMVHIGHPVMGDRLYFSEKSKKLSDELHLDTQQLHAVRLKFFDRISGKNVELYAPFERKGRAFFRKTDA